MKDVKDLTRPEMEEYFRVNGLLWPEEKDTTHLTDEEMRERIRLFIIAGAQWTAR